MCDVSKAKKTHTEYLMTLLTIPYQHLQHRCRNTGQQTCKTAAMVPPAALVLWNQKISLLQLRTSQQVVYKQVNQQRPKYRSVNRGL